jgi:hypothetical protein
MAISTDLNRLSTNVSNLLPADVSQEIQSKLLNASVIQQLARQVSVPGPGLTIPVISGEPTADWVAESAEKPVSRHTLNKLSLTPKKLAVIEPFSDEFRRDLPGLYAELVRRLPNSLALAFDAAAIAGNRDQIGSLYDEGEAAATNADLQTFDATDTYGDILAAITKVATNGYDATGVAVSPSGRALLMGAVSTTGQPLFMPNAMDSTGCRFGVRSPGLPQPQRQVRRGGRRHRRRRLRRWHHRGRHPLRDRRSVGPGHLGHRRGRQGQLQRPGDADGRRFAAEPLAAQHVRRAGRDRDRLRGGRPEGVRVPDRRAGRHGLIASSN